jgi:2-polyprenyl-6-hydroxyphenyl methylase/3-demethylubiquinone-9 3-methyltransferase
MTMRAMGIPGEVADYGNDSAGVAVGTGAAQILTGGGGGNMAQAQASSVLTAEVARFDALAAQWWDPTGPMRPLHQMNPLRVGWIDDRIRARFGGDGARLLDVGCGGGLAAEALAKRGHSVLGIDAAGEAIQAARVHANGQRLRLTYEQTTAEALLAGGQRFEAITALEVIEHVADPATFVATLARLLSPGGLLFISTLNRTPRAFLTAKLGAEYLLRLLPIGTHDFARFVRPAELSAHLRAAGLRLADIAGMVPAPIRGGWRTSRDVGVNYIAMAER